MTENRCIEVLKKMKHMFTETCAKIDENTALDMAVEAIKEIQQYRAMEQRLQKVYGECEGLLEKVVRHLENHENIELPDNIIKARLLTDEDVDKWEGYKAIGTVEEIKEELSVADIQADKLNAYKRLGTIEEFKALKEADMKGANRAVDEFANYLHKIAKENNGLRLSSETKSWTHPCIFDYLEEFKNEQTCKEET